ncbi:competence/damage-inducible protein A [Rufibacter glacialis]|uniref:CinA-like protein n=1 Tax=Rufibacter glacialis TaxID=1259555 RepID=A0A5M8QLS1_9BACT|nr:competence/damage-inducible protein A [Rufibacter glacialis]KAA6435593.1 competence/damage-inducible protein A [Rufibacter glacialis]GGK64830.1 CinA-like protein [Rufibacter glacialis]
MKQEISAEIMTIGDELLYGQVIDTNSAWLGQELGKIGIRVKQITSISDNPDAICEALTQAMARAQVVLVTGGLGPTKDDLTKHTLTRYFKSELQLHQPSLEDVENIFRKYNRPMLEVNRQQAFLPACCTPVRNILGTAPGMLFQEQGTLVVSMPGVPFEMKRMMTDTVLPYLQQHFQLPQIIHKVVQTIGQGESFLAERIAAWEDNLPNNLKLAYLPHLAGVRLRLTGFSDGQHDLETQLQEQVHQLSILLPDNIFAYGEVTLEEAIGQLLKERNLTISTAESCTGGLVAHKLTSVPGSSAYFMGSVVAYSNEVKKAQLGVPAETLDKHGAVSEETVRAMAQGVRQRLHTHIGLATSGIAGPDGGTPEKPVGTIWIAYADAHQTIARQLSYNKTRQLNIEYTALQVLDLIRQSLRHPVDE